MKKIMILFGLLVCTVLGSLSVSAATGEVKDDRVWYTYWDEPSWSVAYTGVVNYLDFQIYAPCVARNGSEWGCGSFAMQGEYKEYGISVASNGHQHGLMNKDRGIDYIVK